MHGGEENCTQCFLIGKPERKRPVGRLRHTWGDIDIMDGRNMMEGCELDLSGSG
jgi:hypothetical protein